MGKSKGSSAVRVALVLALTGCSESVVEPEPDPLGEPDAGIRVGCVQVPETWADGGLQWGTDKSDELLDAVVDRSGRLYLAGYENGALTENIIPAGLAVGALWTLPHGAAQMEPRVLQRFSSSVAIDALTVHPATGALYFAGRTTGAFPGYTSQGKQDLVLGDVDPSGAPRVLFQGGDAYPQHPTRLAFDAAGELFVAGYDDTNVEQSVVTRWEHPFVLRLHPEGGALQEVWWHRWDTENEQDVLMGLGVGSGGVYVSGAVTSGGPNAGPFVRKLDGQGQTLWSRKQSSIAFDMVAAVHVLPDGDVLVAGTTFLELGAQQYGEQDAVVQRLDPATGEPRWTAQFGSAGPEWVMDMDVDPVDGSITLVGETLGTLDPARPNAGDYDAMLIRFSSTGQLLGTQQWGTPGDERASAVAVDACGRAVVVGYTTGALLGPNRGSRDAFVVTTPRTR
jgi:hypothetical protein